MPDPDDHTPLPPLSADGGAEQPAEPLRPPSLQGYEVTRRLGRGGMGTVWRAVQRSTRREVALKVLHLGPAVSERALARFEREVELAARLQHAHIARVYDSGLYEDGYYYAMELVDGAALDAYVLSRDLGRADVLALMRSVCRAVEHAHRRGVIHRDLKPSNILVTDDGRPCVVDFGLAKTVLDEEAGAGVSVGDEVIGTPAYMSPEQAAGRMDEVGTPSDVYSLGVILYRLLTGGMPHDVSGSRNAVLRRIAEEEPARPGRVAAGIDADLEAVLLKALAHDPSARYATAGDLADDLGRYLAGDPLRARRPTLLYFLRKRLRKHRVTAAVAGLSAAALAAFAVWSFVRIADERWAAITARDAARSEAAKANAVTDFFTETMTASDTEGSGGPPVTLAGVLARASTMLEGRFAEQPRLKARIAHSLGQRYEAMGDLAWAEKHFALAHRLRRQHLEEAHADTLASAHGLARVLGKQGKSERAETLYRDTLAARTQAFGDEARPTLRCMNDLANLLADRQRYAEASRLQETLLARSRRALGPHDADTVAFMRSRARVLWEWDRRDEAERMYRAAAEASRQGAGPDHPDTLAAVTELGHTLWSKGEREKALAVYREVAETAEQALGLTDPRTLEAVRTLADGLNEMGRHEAAEPLYRKELQGRQQAPTQDIVAVMETLHEVANALYSQKRYKEARDLHEEVFHTCRRSLGADRTLTLMAANNFAVDMYYLGDCDEAAALHRETLKRWTECMGPDHPHTLTSALNLANALFHSGDREEAVVLYKDVLARAEGQGDACASAARLAEEGLAKALEKQEENGDPRVAEGVEEPGTQAPSSTAGGGQRLITAK